VANYSILRKTRENWHIFFIFSKLPKKWWLINYLDTYYDVHIYIFSFFKKRSELYARARLGLLTRAGTRAPPTRPRPSPREQPSAPRARVKGKILPQSKG
jgi:hypothetical protein